MDEIKSPILSIVVPCYNQAEYLPETLQSVLDQEFQDWECIIVNDGSIDNSESIAKDWAKKDSRIQYYIKANTGVSDTRNFAINKATGKYILPLDADDIISKTYTQKAIDIFNKVPNTKLVYSNHILFGAKNEKIIPKPYSFEEMLTGNLIFCSAIFRKVDFDKTKGYNPNMVNGLEDWDFWLSFLSPEDVICKLDGYHFSYRIKDVSRSTQIDREKNEALILQIFKNHTDLYLQYFNPIRDRIEAQYYKAEYKKIQSSASYKIARIITYPFRSLKRMFK